MEAKRREEDKNGCTAESIWDGTQLDSIHSVEKRNKVEVVDERNMILDS